MKSLNNRLTLDATDKFSLRRFVNHAGEVYAFLQ